MKPSRFEYRSPETLDEAVALLAADHGAKLIAGGQSLIPVLAFRLAAPSLLVDLRRLPDLGKITIDADGVGLGATVRWRDIEDEPQLASAQPLLQAAVGHVARYQIRNRGTVGGSLAHADPAAELPGIAVTCEGQITVVGSAGWRRIPASEFFTAPLTTELHSDEIITELRLPPWPVARRWGFEEFALRQGNFALAGIALYYDEDEQGRARNAHVGVIACAAVRIAWCRSKLRSTGGRSTSKRWRICMPTRSTAAHWLQPWSSAHCAQQRRDGVRDAVLFHRQR